MAYINQAQSRHVGDAVPTSNDTALISIHSKISNIQRMAMELHEVADRALGMEPEANGPECKTVPQGIVGDITHSLETLTETIGRAVNRFMRIA